MRDDDPAVLAAAAFATATVCAHAQSPIPTSRFTSSAARRSAPSGDLAGRLLAQKLTAQMGQPVVFESRPGANGQIAANYVKTLPPDGAHLYVASSTVITGPLMSKRFFHERQNVCRRLPMRLGPYAELNTTNLSPKKCATPPGRY